MGAIRLAISYRIVQKLSSMSPKFEKHLTMKHLYKCDFQRIPNQAKNYLKEKKKTIFDKETSG